MRRVATTRQLARAPLLEPQPPRVPLLPIALPTASRAALQRAQLPLSLLPLEAPIKSHWDRTHISRRPFTAAAQPPPQTPTTNKAEAQQQQLFLGEAASGEFEAHPLPLPPLQHPLVQRRTATPPDVSEAARFPESDMETAAVLGNGGFVAAAKPGVAAHAADAADATKPQEAPVATAASRQWAATAAAQAPFPSESIEDAMRVDAEQRSACASPGDTAGACLARDPDWARQGTLTAAEAHSRALRASAEVQVDSEYTGGSGHGVIGGPLVAEALSGSTRHTPPLPSPDPADVELDEAAAAWTVRERVVASGAEAAESTGRPSDAREAAPAGRRRRAEAAAPQAAPQATQPGAPASRLGRTTHGE